MSKNLPIPTRRFSTNDILKTSVLYTVNARRPRPPNPSDYPFPLLQRTARTKAYRKTASKPAPRIQSPKVIPISATPCRSIIRKFEATPRTFDDEEPIPNTRGRGIIHKYASESSDFADGNPISDSVRIRKHEVNPHSRQDALEAARELHEKNRVARMLETRRDAMETARDLHNANKAGPNRETTTTTTTTVDPPSELPGIEEERDVVRKVAVRHNTNGVSEDYLQYLRKRDVIWRRSKAFLDGKGQGSGGAPATEDYGKDMRQGMGDGDVETPRARRVEAASTRGGVRHASTSAAAAAAGKRELKPVEMGVEMYHRVADRYIDELVGKLEAVQEEREDVDVEYN
ncbi:MAG: hypothetical protein Q9174_004244, partial [Haloplaca sp. 1 TL-2023]